MIALQWYNTTVTENGVYCVLKPHILAANVCRQCQCVHSYVYASLQWVYSHPIHCVTFLNNYFETEGIVYPQLYYLTITLTLSLFYSLHLRNSVTTHPLYTFTLSYRESPPNYVPPLTNIYTHKGFGLCIPTTLCLPSSDSNSPWQLHPSSRPQSHSWGHTPATVQVKGTHHFQ